MEEEIKQNIVGHLDSENSKVTTDGTSKQVKKSLPVKNDNVGSIEDFIVTKESLDTPVEPGKEKSEFDENNIFTYKGNKNDFNVASSDRVEIEGSLDDYREYLGEDIYMPTGGQEAMNITRAQNQGSFEQFRNFLGQSVLGEIVGGTIEGFGYLLDVGSIIDIMRGNETEWGNFITDAGQKIRKETEESLRIYQDPTATGWGKMADPGWWASNAVSVASTFSMMLPTMGATRGLSMLGKLAKGSKGISKGMKATRKAVGLAEEMGTKGKWMRDGISQAVLSRNIENWMEAHGTFESYKQEKLAQINPKTGKRFTEEEATKLASQAASQNWKQGWAMLLQDIPQYLAIGKVFNPITRKMEKSRAFASSRGKTPKQKFKTKKTKNKDGTFTETQVPVTESGVMATLGDVSKQFVGEGLEEGYQYVISQNAGLQTDLETGIITQEQYDKKFKDLFGDEEMMTSMFFGGLGGSLFAATGPVINEASKSKSRKEYEKNIGKNYGKYLSNSAKQIGLLNQYKAQADQSENPDAINHVIDESMMMVVADALERDQYDQFEETLEGIMNMSEQDISEMNKDNEGGEFDPEMAKEYIPELLKKARSMKADYFNLRNRYTPRIAKAVASQNIKTKIYQESKERNSKRAAELLEDIGESWSGAPDRLQRKAKLQSETRANKRTKDRIKKDLDKLKSDKINDNSIEIKRLEERLDIVDKKGKVLYSKTVENNTARVEEKKNYSESEKEENSLQERLINKAFSKEKRTAYESYLYNKDYAEDNILDAQLRIEDFTSPEGIARVKKQEVKDELSKFEGKELSVLEEGLKSVNSSNVMDDSQKKGLQEGLEGMIKKEKSRIRAAQKKANDKANEDSIAQKNADNANPQGMDTPEIDGNKEPLGDSIEEPLHQEMPDIQDALAATDKGTQDKIDEKNTITILNKGPKIEAWQEFVKDPNQKKVGRKVIYSLAPPYETMPQNEKNAAENFQKAKNSQEALDPETIKYLNIQMTVLEENGAETNIVARISNNNSFGGFYSNYHEQRAIIIDKLLKGEDVISEILYTEGGELNVERVFDEDGNVVADKIPENIITDLEGYSEISELDLVVTDEYGKYVKVSNKKEVHEAFSGDTLMVDGKYYKGGVFLVVKKADGSLFPLRLNLKKNSQQEAELLADLVTAITVQTGYGKGKKLSLVNSETTLSEMSKSDVKDVKKLYSKIEEFAPKELALLAKGGSSGTMADLISLFVYYTPNYKEKTGLITELMWGKNGVHFGGQAIGEPARFIDKNSGKEVKEQLIEFFRDTKRRQFNIDKWNNMPGYREYVIKEGIINTDVKTNEPLFFDNGQSRAKDRENGGKEQRKIRAHVGKIKGDSSQKVELLDKYSDRQIPKELEERIAKTEVTKDEQGGHAFFYKKGQEPPMRPVDKIQKTHIYYESREIALSKYIPELEALPKKTVQKPVTPSGGAKAQKRGVVKPTQQTIDPDKIKSDRSKELLQLLDAEIREKYDTWEDFMDSDDNLELEWISSSKISAIEKKYDLILTKDKDSLDYKIKELEYNKEKDKSTLNISDKQYESSYNLAEAIKKETGIEFNLTGKEQIAREYIGIEIDGVEAVISQSITYSRVQNGGSLHKAVSSTISELVDAKYNSKIEKLKKLKSNPAQQPKQQTVQDIVKNDPEFEKKNKEKSIQEKIKVLTSNPKGLKKIESNGDRYYQDKYGRRYTGISSIVNPSTFEDRRKGESKEEHENRIKDQKLKYGHSVKIGTAVDETLRDFFAGKNVSYEDYASEFMSQDVFDELIQTAERFKEKYKGKNVVFLTEGLFLSDYSIKASQVHVDKAVKSDSARKKEYGIATELDMVVVNKDTGSVDLVDFKTVRTRPGAEIFDSAYSEKKINGYSKQQNASRLLIEKNTGIKFNSMSLMPIRVYYPDYGKTTDVAKVNYNLTPLKKESVKEVFPEYYAKQFGNKEKEISDTKTSESGKNEVNLGSKDEQPASSGMTRAEEAKLRRANRRKKGNKIPAINTGGAQQENSSNAQLENMKKATDNSDQVNEIKCTKKGE